MPQSDTFAPSVAQSPGPQQTFSAGSVDPMRNAAPEQMQQMGGAVSNLGSTADSIGERIQWQMDDAKTKMAESQFLQQAMQITHGDGTAQNPGFLNTRGQDTLDSYDGATAALAQAKAQGMSSLNNKFQQMMFNRVSTQHLTSIGSVMADHRFQQGTQFAVQAADDSATMYGLQAANAWKSYNQTDADGNAAGNFKTFSQVRDQRVLDGQRQRIGTDDPTTPQNQYALLQARSTTSKTALSQMITSQAPAPDVQGFFDSMKAKGYIDPRDEVAMASAVKSYVVPKQLNDNINQALSDAYRANHPQPAGSPAAQGPTDYRGPITGAGVSTTYDPDAEGAYITIPTNTPVQAPGSGTVSAVGKNDDGVPYVSIDHPDGSTSTLTGMSTFNIKAGDPVKMGQQIGTSGDSGDQKNASVLWQLADKNGAAIDPTHAGLPPVNIQGITDEKTLTDALASFHQSEANPDQQRQGALDMEGIVRQNQHMVQQAQQQNVQAADNQFYAGFLKNGRPDVGNIDPTLLASLPPEQQYKYTEIVTEQRRRALSDAREAQSASAATAMANPAHLGSLYWLATHPDATLSDLTGLAKNLTPQETIEAARSMTTHDVKDAPIDQAQLRLAFTHAGLQGLVNMDGQTDAQKLDSQQRYLTLHDQLQTTLNAAQAAKKAPLSPAESQKVMNDLLINNVVSVHQTSMFRSTNDYSHDTPVNFASMTSDQAKNAYVMVGNTRVPEGTITPDRKDSLTAELLNAGHSATESNIATVWLKTPDGQQWLKAHGGQ